MKWGSFEMHRLGNPVTKFYPRPSFCSCWSLLTDVTCNWLTAYRRELPVIVSSFDIVLLLNGCKNEQTCFWFIFVYAVCQWHEKGADLPWVCVLLTKTPETPQSQFTREVQVKKNPWIPDKFLASWGEAHKEGVVHYQKCIKWSNTALDKFKKWLLVNVYWKFLYLPRTAPWGHFQKSCQKYQIWKQTSDSNILQVINGTISLRREYFP